MISGKVNGLYLGDQSEFTVDFEGTPPFSFTYSRMSDGQDKQRKESITVEDITGYRV